MYYYGKSESSACGKTEKMEDKTIWVYPDAEEGWDEVNPVFKRKLKAIYDTAHDIQLTATSIYDLELGQLYQQCHLIKVEEERLLYECKNLQILTVLTLSRIGVMWNIKQICIQKNVV